MAIKPPRWNVSPALIAPEAQPLWKGLAFITPLWGAEGGKGVLLNALGQSLADANLVAGSTAERRATPYGQGVGISGASNLLSQSGLQPVITSNGAGTGDFTVVILANPAAEARASVGVSQFRNANPNNMFQIAFNSDGYFNGAVSGQLNFTTYSSNIQRLNFAGAVDGEMHLFGGIRRGTAHYLYVDGLQKASMSGLVQTISSGNTNGFGIGQRPVTGGSRIATTCSVVFAAAWNRALSNAEMRLLARDPFCMFRMADEWPGVWTAIGAYFLNADPASFGITGAAAGAVAGRMVDATATSYAITGTAAATVAGRVVTALPAAFDITGAAAGAIADRIITASPATYTITGVAADILAGRVLNAEPGVIAITGVAADLIHTSAGAFVLNADPASFSITGIAAGIVAGRALSADPGALVITGAAADLVYTVTGAYSLNADPGVFSVTGATAGTIAGRVIDALAGGYAVTGLSASIVAGRALSADPAAYTITGANAGVLAGRVIAAEPGVYTVTGANAAAITARLLAADPGAYVITGLAATFTTGLGVQTYAAQILIMSDAREIIIIDDAREIVVN